jgi:NAD(P)-dependent dehydrogenase (short-subunit alcohol dehydrogenase family)
VEESIMMPRRLSGRTVIVSGGGQTPGQTIGNGRATAILFARAGANVFVVDRDAESAGETAREIVSEGGNATAWQADMTVETEVRTMVGACVEQWGRVDVLHNNVGVSLGGGDAPITEIDATAFAQVTATNLQSMVLTSKYVVPVMRAQGSGVICNISSIAAIIDYPYIAYQTSKAGVLALTRNLAITNAQYGIRANAILPGLLNTPMAIEPRAARNPASRPDIIADREAKVPLGRRMGTGWDVAHAALFLASDEAGFITGAELKIDGGQSLVVG